MVRWRGGRSRGPACSAVSSRCSSDAGSSNRARAAASSRASGQPGEPLAGGADGRGVGRVGAPAGVDPLRAVEQQPCRGGGRPVRVVVHLERLHGVLRLAAHAQRRAAGGQDGQVGHGLDDRGDVRRGVEEVLDVVQHEQQVLAAQPVDDVVGDGLRGVAGGGHGVGDGWEQLARLEQRRELDQAYAVGVAVADRSPLRPGTGGSCRPRRAR